MNRSVIVIGGMVVALLTTSLLAEDEKGEAKKAPSFWMKKKLIYSQEILNGLVTEDFELIQKNAMRMKALNVIESFVRRKPEGYRTQLKIFQFSINEIVRSAEDKNLDRAALAFTQMTISCVNCHKGIRKK